MIERFAFFDACTHHPNATNSEFVVAGRLAGRGDTVESIHRLAERLRAPVVSTSCQCMYVQRANPEISVRKTVLTASATYALRATETGNVAARTMRAGARAPELQLEYPSVAPVPEFAFVAMDATEEDVELALQSRCIVLERYSCATSEENKRLRSYDPFTVNRNAAHVVRSLNDRHWIVFGRSVEFCVLSIVEGLRALDAKVSVLEDLCDRPGSTPETHWQAVACINALGAEWRSLDSIFAEVNESLPSTST